MIGSQVKDALNDLGDKLSKMLPGFYGKLTFNFYNGRYVNLNIEQSIKKDNLNKRSKEE